MKARGQGRYEKDRPLVMAWVERNSPLMAIQMCRDAGARTLTKATLKHVVPGSRLDTDSWKGYNWLGQIYEHHIVKHSEAYVAETFVPTRMGDRDAPPVPNLCLPG